MKDKIIECVENIDKRFNIKGYEKQLWKDMFIELAQSYPEIENNQEVISKVTDILENVNIDSIIAIIDSIKNEISNELSSMICKVFLIASLDLSHKNDMELRELKEILSELAVPIIRVWKNILLCPLVGTLDSERAQTMAEKLLQMTSESRARYVIIDVTGISIIDTIVGGFLIELFKAIKLLGSDVILTGIKPNIAHTLVKLGIDFNMINVKRDLESGLKFAISTIEK